VRNIHFLSSCILAILVIAVGSGVFAEAENGSVCVRMSADHFRTADVSSIREVDYGSFVWAELSPQNYQMLSESGLTFTLYSEPYTLTLGEQIFDTRNENPVFPQGWEPIRSDSADLHLVQMIGPVKTAWQETLTNNGLEIVQYIHPFTYVVWGLKQDVNNVSNQDFIHWIGSFAPAFRVLPKWRNLNSAPVDLDVLFYRGADVDEAVRQIASMGARNLGRDNLNNIYTIAGFQMPGSALQIAAQIPGVYSIQLRPLDGGLRTEMSDQVCVNNVDGDNWAFPGYPAWLTSVGLDGYGVIMANVDSGVDQSHADIVGRIISCSGQTCGGSSSSSHGTHTAGIMAGDATSGVTDSYGFLRGLGMAPGANLVEQVYSPWFTQPGGMLLLMTDSYNNAASLSSNSWGPSGSPEGYDNDTLQVDIGVRDADPDVPGNQPLSYMLSIMNGGGGTSSQGSPDEAKNIFTIGSTKMQNSNGSQIQDIDDISSNSAHGPCLDGREIPHMVAPGCYVDSSVPGGYSTMCGTSMSSPHVSGATALFIEYYRNVMGMDPSPAMVKAAFLPVCRDLFGNQDADGGTLGHPFDSKQGWGRMDTEAVVDPQVSMVYIDDPQVLDNTGEIYEKTVFSENGAEPVKIMLVWTDAPGHGLGGSTPAWNNDLDLEVIVGGNTYLGNNFGADGWSQTGGSPDGMNNTEGVFLPAGSRAPLTLRVIGSDINSDGIPNVGDTTDQDFALVITNVIDQSSDGVVSMDNTLYSAGMTINIQVSDLDLHGGGTLNVTMESDSEPGGEIVVLTETGPDTGIFTGSIMTTASSSVPGQLTIAHNDEIRAEYYDEDSGGGTPEYKYAYATADLMGPVISNVQIINIGYSSAEVTWDTNETATSKVEYGIDQGLGMTMEDTALTLSHSMLLEGLDDCTLYYLQVASSDAAQNETIDDNSGNFYLFVTLDLVVLLEETMDSNPGWSVEDQWAYGQPTGQGGDYGSPDPISGYTGDNVEGFNLSGDYPNDMPSTEYLITTSFDCSSAAEVFLSFWCWLGLEQNIYDEGYIDVSNNGGSNWTNIWTNSVTLDGGSWELWEFDISGIAAGYSDVMVRWGVGPTDVGWQYCGWNIDDVLVSFSQPCGQTTPTPGACNNDGDVNLNGTITAEDAQLAFSIALGVMTPTLEEFCAADCNDSGDVTAGDAQIIFATALGLDSCVDPV